jgi:molybdate transport system substrate-binding protein
MTHGEEGDGSMLMGCFRQVAAGLLAALTFAVVTGSAWAQGDAARPVLVFAAASLKNALDDVAARWQVESGRAPTISYAASSALAKQIEQGAPADLFISADLDWMDYLDQRKLIRPGTRVDLLGNRIALVARQDVSTRLIIAPGLDLASALGNGRLAMANVAAVPAGKYGKTALEALGVWPSVAGKIAQADNVRAALLLVARGEAPLGIVYQTDAAAEPGVRVVGLFPEDSHPPIIYPAAVVATSKNADAQRMLDYLRSAIVRPLFEKQGFTVLK